jgi:hypothetical protein
MPPWGDDPRRRVAKERDADTYHSWAVFILAHRVNPAKV